MIHFKTKHIWINTHNTLYVHIFYSWFLTYIVQEINIFREKIKNNCHKKELSYLLSKYFHLPVIRKTEISSLHNNVISTTCFGKERLVCLYIHYTTIWYKTDSDISPIMTTALSVLLNKSVSNICVQWCYHL